MTLTQNMEVNKSRFFQILPLPSQFFPACGLFTRHSKQVFEDIPCGTPPSRFLGATSKGPWAKKNAVAFMTTVTCQGQPSSGAADTSLRRQTDKREEARD